MLSTRIKELAQNSAIKEMIVQAIGLPIFTANSMSKMIIPSIGAGLAISIAPFLQIFLKI